MGAVGGYVLHLYCDSEGEHPHGFFGYDSATHASLSGSEFSGDTKAEAFAAARKAGWTVDAKAEPKPGGNGWGRAYCRLHRGERRA